jgi:hypothetical protein
MGECWQDRDLRYVTRPKTGLLFHSLREGKKILRRRSSINLGASPHWAPEGQEHGEGSHFTVSELAAYTGGRRWPVRRKSVHVLVGQKEISLTVYSGLPT